MCGIVAVVGGTEDRAWLAEIGAAASRHRGPDAIGVQAREGVALGHARLAILDLDARSNQPFRHGAISLTYNGELWNYKDLRLMLPGHRWMTTGDTEVLAALLEQFGSAVLYQLQGMFAFAWTDGSGALWLARDRFGEMPLHVGDHPGGAVVAASERKVLLEMGVQASTIEDVGPGEVWKIQPGEPHQITRWYEPSDQPVDVSPQQAVEHIRAAVSHGVVERRISDAPVCTLLSGGIDSALIAALLKPHFPDLVAFTAVMDPRSPDLKATRLLAEHLQMDLVEVHVPAPSAEDLLSVVRMIEMPSKAQVEIGWACLQLAQAIRDSGIKVTFSGEGSDELWASYGFAYHGVQRMGWHAYRKQLFLSQARKNFPRANKIFMARSVECRLPFLNTQLVELALSLPRDRVEIGRRPKGVLRDAFADLLPRAITSRPKLAFQDGLGLKADIAGRISDPRRMYDDEFRRVYGGSSRAEQGTLAL